MGKKKAKAATSGASSPPDAGQSKRGGSKASQYIIQRKAKGNDHFEDLKLKVKPKNSIESKKTLAEAISSGEVKLQDGDEFRIIAIKATGIKPKVATITKVEL